MSAQHGVPVPTAEPQPFAIGRYLLHRPIARGGMASIYLARLIGDEGFSRIVVAKRLLPELAGDAEFVAMFLDEARIASRIHHRNVVPVLDVVTAGGEVILVQDYVHGASLHWLLNAARRNKTRVPIEIAVSIGCQVLSGLHAAHETLDEVGTALAIVHRDVSPQNVMVAVDGTARLLDFGIAKATMAVHITREGQFKGKLAYAAPEQLRGHATQQSDLYSLAVLLWELVVGHHMHHKAQTEVELIAMTMSGRLPTITEALAGQRDAMTSEHWRALEAIEPIIQTGLAAQLAGRWTTAADMERALTEVVRPASLTVVATWLKSLGKAFIDQHDRVLAAEEASWRRLSTTMRRRLAQSSSQLSAEPALPAETPLPPPSEASEPSAPSQAIGWRSRFTPKSVIAVLGSFIATFAVGLVFTLRSPSAKPPPASPAAPVPSAAVPAPAASSATAVPTPALTTAPAPAAAAVPTSAASSAAAVPAPAVAPTEPPLPSAVVVAPLPTTPVPQPEAAPGPAPPPTTRHPTAPAHPVRPPSSSAAAPAKKPPPATPSTPATAPHPPAEPTDCNPPYYYEGSKKIFKPECV